MSSWSSGEILSKDKLNEMEDNLSSVTSTYNKTIWNNEDIVTADKLNNLENGISTFIPTYSKHTWVDDEEITAIDLNNIDISQKTFEIGDVVVKDGVESVCVYKEETRQDWGQYLFVDKNHDLSYYISGSDYVNEEDNENACINLEAKYGYEWGAYIFANVKDTNIGKGLSNTNSLIALLSDTSSSWPILWDKITEFRADHSNDWFVPSFQEGVQFTYMNNNLLNNLSQNSKYWTSTEYTTDTAEIVGSSGPYSKNFHRARVRLCFYL